VILIALGANLPSRFGAPEKTFEAARLSLAARGVQVIKTSRVWKTAPVPVSDQPWYSNAVIAVQTDLSPQGLHEVLKSIEIDFGRIPSERNSARLIDLDLIAYGAQIIDEPGLVVPHPRMNGRGFVLLPLQEIAPDWVHPVTRKPIELLVRELSGAEIANCQRSAA
jgi:2-amino-4-hydroxy-6-hydroxymethyldihydropteridine diphosphokinase